MFGACRASCFPCISAIMLLSCHQPPSAYSHLRFSLCEIIFLYVISTLQEYICENQRCRIIRLLSRSSFPPRGAHQRGFDQLTGPLWELQLELNVFQFVSKWSVSVFYFIFLQGRVVHKGPLVSLAADNVILKTVIQGSFRHIVTQQNKSPVHREKFRFNPLDLPWAVLRVTSSSVLSHECCILLFSSPV